MNRIIFLPILYLLSIILAILGGYWIGTHRQEALQSPAARVIPRPLEKYTYDSLKIRGGISSEIKTESTLKEEDGFTSYLVSFTSDGKRITGQLNIPQGAGPFPAILQYRGYVDPKGFKTGAGTAPSARVYARNGFITFAPDFLGHGGSDPRMEGQIAARLENYTTALDALASLENLKQVDKENIFLWGHSNGGHLAVATLEISGKDYPTTLWAPVTAPFPHSSLFFQDELSDKGKQLRRDIAEFEELYDVFKFSPDNYTSWINAPIQLHQGTADVEVPRHWSDNFVEDLEKKDKDITYFVYPGTNHNMQPAWETIVSRDLVFFRKHLDE